MTANGVTLPSPTATADSERDAPLPGARHALILLLLINLFNYIDRQVLSAVLPNIKDAFLADDPKPQTKLGALTTVFMISYMVLAPLFGWLGDKYSRWRLIAIGVVLWSVATGASGLADSFFMLLVTRCFVGIGEAAYGPVAPTIISDMYPIRRRGGVLSWFYMAIPVGSALGYVVGGAVATTALGWRGAFYVCVVPGILLGLWAILMRDPQRGQADGTTGEAKSWRDYLALFKIPSYVLNTLGMTAMTFVLGGLAAFMPQYIYEREARFQFTADARTEMAKNDKIPAEVAARFQEESGDALLTYAQFMDLLKQRLDSDQMNRHAGELKEQFHAPGSMGLAQINIFFGGIVVISGLVATLLGGLAGDKLRDRFPGAYFLVSGIGMLIGFPLLISVLWTPFPYAWGAIFGAVFFLFFNTGPTNTVLANVTHPAVRSTAFALNIFIIHAFGDAISPVVLGTIKDEAGWNTAITVASTLILVSGAFWLWGAKYLQHDTEMATRTLATKAP
jgi:MFS family permease